MKEVVGDEGGDRPLSGEAGLLDSKISGCSLLGPIGVAECRQESKSEDPQQAHSNAWEGIGFGESSPAVSTSCTLRTGRYILGNTGCLLTKSIGPQVQDGACVVGRVMCLH